MEDSCSAVDSTRILPPGRMARLRGSAWSRLVDISTDFRFPMRGGGTCVDGGGTIERCAQLLLDKCR